MRYIIRRILKEEIEDGKVICDNCGWTWDLSDGSEDKHVCHKCGHDNQPKPFDRLLSHFEQNFPNEEKNKIEKIKKFVKNFITENNFKVKFLNPCPGYPGVRTKNEIIVCTPTNMRTIGDFLYTIFHEIRHEQQITSLKMTNPLSEMDLEDFEKLYEKYWEMELDADKFPKEKIAEMVLDLDIPLEFAIEQFKLSTYIENYPSMSKMVEMSLRHIVNQIIQIKKSGEEFTDISDHPMVKKYINNLEKFI